MPTVNATIPVLQVRDIEASVAFYQDKLGFRAVHQEVGFAILQRDSARLHLTLANDERWRERSNLAQRPVVSGAESFLAGTGSCRISVAGVDQLFIEFRAQGVIHPQGRVRDQWWGERDFGVLDADGNLLTFFERHVGEATPSVPTS
jgi:catechol 2,3-dioxygenase-like lactoylglutathione lyase family enzyme